ncbi:ABC transporter substrate-binding protein [Halorhabdus sp. CUG00001]|uniref:ABC transporter substrate-binding protein n=1 Tax=Halorhabdus sp. CUG00001 TaxID=2600297 RepID=UPI00131CB42E|nr:ABC transporter substrate-binding protein [Halorhabdus sp. CUG00001]
MGRGNDSNSAEPSRRTFLQAATGIGAIATAGCLGSRSETTTQPGPAAGETVTIGITVATSGEYAVQGEEERRGAELAVKHINEGGGWVEEDFFDELSGDGLLGKTVDVAVRNTASDPETARSAAQDAFDADHAVMLCGGTAGQPALAQADVAANRERIHMVTGAQIDAITSGECSQYSFREMFNSYSTAKVLRAELADRLGSDDIWFHQIHANNDWGREMQSHIQTELAELGWNSAGTAEVMVGTQEFGPMLETVDQESPDVLFLNLPGFDAATAIPQAKDKLGDDMTIVVPRLTRRIAETAGSKITGVLGTIPWDPVMARFDPTSLSRTLVNAYGNEYTGEGQYDAVPAGPTHLAYSQVMQYAAAVERAGTFDADAVSSALTDHSYNVGMSVEQTLRACDHQSTRPAPIVEGRIPGRQRFGHYFALDTISTETAYECDTGPATDCSL